MRIHLDRVEQLGTFIELEAVAPPTSDPSPEYELVAELRETFEISDDRLVALGYAEQLLHASPVAYMSGVESAAYGSRWLTACVNSEGASMRADHALTPPRYAGQHRLDVLLGGVSDHPVGTHQVITLRGSAHSWTVSSVVGLEEQEGSRGRRAFGRACRRRR